MESFFFCLITRNTDPGFPAFENAHSKLSSSSSPKEVSDEFADEVLISPPAPLRRIKLTRFDRVLNKLRCASVLNSPASAKVQAVAASSFGDDSYAKRSAAEARDSETDAKSLAVLVSALSPPPPPVQLLIAHTRVQIFGKVRVLSSARLVIVTRACFINTTLSFTASFANAHAVFTRSWLLNLSKPSLAVDTAHNDVNRLADGWHAFANAHALFATSREVMPALFSDA